MELLANLLTEMEPKVKNYKADDAHLRRIIHNEKENFESYRTGGKRFAFEIEELLKHKPGLSVARCKLGGSVGKGSSLGIKHQPDFDIIVFLNGIDLNEDKPLAKSLKIIHQVIGAQSPGEFTVNPPSEFAVRCVERCSGIQLDIVPAVNFHKPHLHGPPVDVQWKACLEMLPRMGLRQKYLSSSMSEAVVRFVKEQSEFVRGVIILAKLWKQNHLAGQLPKYVGGLASMVELVAIKAAQEELERAGSEVGEPSYALALIGFLRIFTLPIHEVRVYFHYDFPVKSAESKFQHMITQSETGILLDPVNPYNNFLMGVNVFAAWKKIRQVAQGSAKLFFSHNQRPKSLEQDMSLLDKIIN